jgi:hypothetical protein
VRLRLDGAGLLAADADRAALTFGRCICQIPSKADLVELAAAARGASRHRYALDQAGTVHCKEIGGRSRTTRPIASTSFAMSKSAVAIAASESIDETSPFAGFANNRSILAISMITPAMRVTIGIYPKSL